MVSHKRVPRPADDSGAALMVALIFILAVGLMITAILNKSGGVLRTNLAVRDTAQVQYGADAAVDRALEVLRNDLKGTPTICASEGGTLTDFGAGDSAGFRLPGNSHTMRYTCQTVNGRARGSGGSIDNNFAVVVTTTAAGGLTTSNAVKDGVPVGGAIYLAGSEANSDLNKIINVTNASVFENYDPRVPGAHTACQNALNLVTKIAVLTDGFGKSCTAETVTDAIPPFNLPNAPTGTVNPKAVDYTVGGKTCRVFLPGTYTTDLDSLLITGNPNPNKHGEDANYFLSGRYYLTGSTNIANNRIIFGGLPRTDATATPPIADKTVGPPMSDTGCAPFDGVDLSTPWSLPLTTLETKLTALWASPPNGIALATWPNAIWKAGIQLVMGKGASISIKGAALSLSSPTPADSDVNGKLSVSMIAARQDKWVTSGPLDSTRYAAWDNTGGTMLDDTDPNAQLVVNGALMAPDASVLVFASNNTIAVTRAGLVAKTVDLAAAASVQQGSFSFQSGDTNPTHAPSPAQRTVKITVTVDGSPFTETAVATIDNFSPYAIRVFSWRAGEA